MFHGAIARPRAALRARHYSRRTECPADRMFPSVTPLAGFPARSAKIRCRSPQPIATAVATAFVIQRGGRKGE